MKLPSPGRTGLGPGLRDDASRVWEDHDGRPSTTGREGRDQTLTVAGVGTETRSEADGGPVLVARRRPSGVAWEVPLHGAPSPTTQAARAGRSPRTPASAIAGPLSPSFAKAAAADAVAAGGPDSQVLDGGHSASGSSPAHVSASDGRGPSGTAQPHRVPAASSPTPAVAQAAAQTPLRSPQSQSQSGNTLEQEQEGIRGSYHHTPRTQERIVTLLGADAVSPSPSPSPSPSHSASRVSTASATTRLGTTGATATEQVQAQPEGARVALPSSRSTPARQQLAENTGMPNTQADSAISDVALDSVRGGPESSAGSRAPGSGIRTSAPSGVMPAADTREETERAAAAPAPSSGSTPATSTPSPRSGMRASTGTRAPSASGDASAATPGPADKDGSAASAAAKEASALLCRRSLHPTGSLPPWLLHAFDAAGASRELLGRGYVGIESVPDLPFAPIASYTDAQPIRTVCFDPCTTSVVRRYFSGSTGYGGARGGEGGGDGTAYVAAPLLAIGTNSKDLHMASLDGAGTISTASASGASGSSAGSGLSVQHSWKGLHLGSVYCSSWAPVPGSSCSSSLLATGSNDTTVKIVLWEHPVRVDEDELLPISQESTLLPAASRHMLDGSSVDESVGASGGAIGGWSLPLGAPVPEPLLSIPTDASTIRDVCWLLPNDTSPSAYTSSSSLPSPSSSGGMRGSQVPLLLAVGGGGDCAVRVYDCTQTFTAGTSTGTSPPLLRLHGHTGIVYAIRQWGADGRQLVSASGDGTVRLWDTRMASAAAVLSRATLASSGSTPTSTAKASKPAELFSLAVRTPDAAGMQPREVVVGTSDGRVLVWDVTTSRMVCGASVHKAEVRSVDALGPLILSGGSDGVAISAVTAPTSAADGPSLLVAQRLLGHRDKVLCTRWHPTEPLIATSAADRMATVWSLPE